MAAIGQDTLTSIARHYILPQVTDNAYLKNNALLYRLIRGNKRYVQGGTQIEIPLMYKRFSGVGGTYRGFEVLNTAPQDTVKNAYVEWKQHYTSFAIDGLTLIKTDSPLAIANIINMQGQQMYMEMGENLAAGIFSNGTTDPKDIDGLAAIIGTTNNYAGIDRSLTANAFWRSVVDSATATLAFTAMRGLFGNATYGASHPTIWFGNGVNYNRLYALNTSTTGYAIHQNREPGGHDELLAQAGFTNLLFENVPFIRDDNMANTTIYALNENFLALVVSPRADFYLRDFEQPTGQDGYVTYLLWAGNMICMNSRAQAALTNLSA